MGKWRVLVTGKKEGGEGRSSRSRYIGEFMGTAMGEKKCSCIFNLNCHRRRINYRHSMISPGSYACSLDCVPIHMIPSLRTAYTTTKDFDVDKILVETILIVHHQIYF